MRFSSTLAIGAALISSVRGDLHNAGFCVDYKDYVAQYNYGATVAACAAYKLRNKGTQQWNTCPDCEVSGSTPPTCFSDAWHIGGDELSYYCKQAGAGASMAS